MQPIKLHALKTFLNKQPFTFIRLVDSSGNVIAAWNTKVIALKNKIVEMENKLKGIMQPDGIYFVEYKNAAQGPINSFQVHKGNLKPEIIEKKIAEIQEQKENSKMTTDEIINLRVECEKLKLENENLKSEILALTTESEEQDGLQEDAPDMFTTMLEKFGLPLLDKYFQLEEKKIALMQEQKPKEETAESIMNKKILTASKDELVIMVRSARELGPTQEAEMIEYIFRVRPDAINLFVAE